MRKVKAKHILFLITFFALIIRLYRLGSIPPSLHWDEPSWGYNAYSILKTGRDEYGNWFPLIFKAFGDYKAPVYAYLTVLPVALFGLNEFAVRLPAALFGTLSVWLVYWVAVALFARFKDRQKIGLLSSLVLALSPWHYHYSHGAWEVNVLLVFLFLGIYFFIKADKKKPSLWLFSALFFGLCFYIYSSAKLLIPLIIVGLVYHYRDKLARQNTRVLLTSLIILGVMILPVLIFTFKGGAGGRLKIMSLFSYSRSPEEVERVAREGLVSQNSWLYQIFYGPIPYFTRGFLGRYLNHFSGRFLFFEGDWTNHRHGVAYAGVLNHLDFVFLILGTYFLVSRKVKNQPFIWYFLTIAPLPAALSRDVIQATRSYLMVFPFAIINAFGMYFFYFLLKKIPKVIAYFLIVIFVFGYLFSFAYYLDLFMIHAPKVYSQFWQYGYREAVEFIKDRTRDYDQVIYTQKHGQPYIYYLFYSQYEPKKYQFQAKLIEHPGGDVGRVEKIDNIEFREIYWPGDRILKKTLFVGTQYELPPQDIHPDQARILKEIKYLNGEVAFRIVETL